MQTKIFKSYDLIIFNGGRNLSSLVWSVQTLFTFYNLCFTQSIFEFREFKSGKLGFSLKLTMNGETGSGSYTPEIIIRLTKVQPLIFRSNVFYFQSAIHWFCPPGWHVTVLSIPFYFWWGHPTNVTLKGGRVSNQNGDVFRLLTKIRLFCGLTMTVNF